MYCQQAGMDNVIQVLVFLFFFGENGTIFCHSFDSIRLEYFHYFFLENHSIIVKAFVAGRT